MDNGEDPFKYQSLNGDDSIRLLLLAPAGARQDDLRGTLLHTTLSECITDLLESYTALSYCWGDPRLSCRIHLDGHLLGITSSLDMALRDMRHTTRTHRIWVDALCIEQCNQGEKNRQVALMGRIYSTASHTIIHLPLLSSQARDTLDFALRSDLRSEPAMDSANYRKPPGFEEARQEILAAPWFTRAWVFQELALSRDPWVQSASSRARWSAFCNLLGMEQVADAMRLHGMAEIANYDANPFVMMTQNQAQRFSLPLFDLLACRRGVAATNDRDLVYANLGLTQDRAMCEKYIVVDYSKTVERVFFDSARYILEAKGFGELIAEASIRRKRQRVGSNMPSWVPDWTCPPPKPQTVLPPSLYAWMTSNKLINHRDYDETLTQDGLQYFALEKHHFLSFIGMPFDRVGTLLDEYSNKKELAGQLGSLPKDHFKCANRLYQLMGIPMSVWPRLRGPTMRDGPHEIPGFLHDEFGIDMDSPTFDDAAADHAFKCIVRLYEGIGKRLAQGSSSIVVVPRDTRPGDVLVRVCYTCEVLVIRPLDAKPPPGLEEEVRL
ncbi:hypothetical protein OQA88_5469 [Cercophora sp. LCS_1]